MHLLEDLSPADWLVAQLHDFAVDVGSVIPDGFATYARLLHPATRIDGGDEVPVRWSEIAANNGRRIHPEVQWPHITGTWEPSDQGSGGWDVDPAVGSLPREYTRILKPLLTRHTSTPQRIFYCVWDGFAGLSLDPDEPSDRTTAQRSAPAPTLQLPSRSYYLLSGPLDGISESMCDDPFWQSANLWWPEDRAWCVATEIDFAWTYVGGEEALIHELINHPDLEGLRTRPDHAITFEADRVNPPPTGHHPG